MARPRQLTNAFQTAVRMPDELRQRLQAAAGDRPLGEEIRRRLEASFEDTPPAADEKTASLLKQIAALATVVSEHYGAWHETPKAYAIFKSAIDLGLRDYDPALYDAQGMETSAEPSGAEKAEMERAAFMAAAAVGFTRIW